MSRPNTHPARSGSTDDRRVTWVLPAYNEAASVTDLLGRIAEVSTAQGWVWQVILVDDGSTDATGELALEGARAGLPVEVVRNEPNRGLGYSIRRGLREASALCGSGTTVLTMDADLTHDPCFAPAMLAKLDEGFDVVIASRFRHGSGVEGLSVLRRFLSFAACGVVLVLRPIRGVRDYSCGFRAYRCEVIADAFAEYGDDFVSETGFACMVEIAERLRGRAAFAEVPFVLRYQDKRKASEIRILPTIGAYFRVIRRVALGQSGSKAKKGRSQ